MPKKQLSICCPCSTKIRRFAFLPARRYASATTGCGRVSVTSRCSIETGFWRGSFLRPILHCHKEIQISSKIRVFPSVTLLQTQWTSRISPLHDDRRIVLSTLVEKGGRSEHDKLGRRQSTKLIVSPSSDRCSLSHNRQALSTAWFRRAGQSATADIVTFKWPNIIWKQAEVFRGKSRWASQRDVCHIGG